MATMEATATLERDVPGGAGERSVDQLYLVLSCSAPHTPPARHLLANVDTIRFGRAKKTAWSRNTTDGVRTLDVGLHDGAVSSRHAELTRGDGGFVLRDLGSKNGTSVDGERVKERRLHDGALIEIGSVMFLFRAQSNVPLGLPEDGGPSPAPLATLVPSLHENYSRLAKIAASTEGVLICGETGTGKELTARAIHTLSAREGDFVGVNCASLVGTLLEAQLFGHVRGAFTGAAEDRAGLIETSSGGTLFLDEIGELPTQAQATLLRTLQEREVLRVGATRATAVDLRVVSATLRDVSAMIADKSFRDDLYARVAGYTVHLPPLRERIEDLGLLVSAILRAEGHEDVTLTTEAARALFRHPWPRNIRELSKALRTAVVLGDGKTIRLADLPEAVRTGRPAGADDTPADPDATRRAHIIQLLEKHRGNVTRVAEEMGKLRQQIHKWCRRYDIDPAAYRR